MGDNMYGLASTYATCSYSPASFNLIAKFPNFSVSSANKDFQPHRLLVSISYIIITKPTNVLVIPSSLQTEGKKGVNLRCQESKEKEKRSSSDGSHEEEGGRELWFRAQVDERKKDRRRSFGSVFVAFSKRPYMEIDHMPEAMAMKSARITESKSIQYELEVFKDLNNQGGSCPFIIDHYGEEVTWSDEGEEVYNLALEVAWGSLARLIKVTGHGLLEPDVRRYTCDILEGVRHIHKCGYVHCDLKPDNILIVENEDDDDHGYSLVAKVADLGLAKKKDEIQDSWRGTPMYLSPEVVLYNEQEQPSDIWAVGCIVLEMLTGERPRNHFYHRESDTLYIVDGLEPKIPDTISSLARDFLGCCLSEARCTAEELLSHPFVAGY